MKNGGLFTDENGKFSKGKIGAVIVMFAALLTVIGQFMQGTGDMMTIGQAIITFAIGLGIFGVRDSKKTDIED